MVRRVPVYLCLALILILLSTSPAFAQSGGNIAKGLLDSFISETDSWWATLRGYALFLFTTTLTLEVCLFGIRMALQQSNIGEVIGQFVTLLLFAGFIAAVIVNYQEWATGIAINGLKPLVGEMTGNNVDAGHPFAMASILIDRIIFVLSTADIRDIAHIMLYEGVLFILIITFVLISALVIIVTCEFYIAANIGVLLVGLGGSKIFKDYAVNAMRYVLAVAVKLFVLQLIVNVGFSLLSMSSISGAAGMTIKDVKFVELFYIIGKAIILLALAKTLPDTCAGIINGSAIGGGNPLVSMGKMAGTMAMGAVTAGAGYAAGAASAINDAHTVAKGEGASGMGVISGMGRAMLNARQDAKAGGEQKNLEQNPSSMRNQLKSKANATKAQRLLGDSDQSAPSDAAQTESSANSSVTNPADGSNEAASSSHDGYQNAPSAADGAVAVASPVGGSSGSSPSSINSQNLGSPTPDPPEGGGGGQQVNPVAVENSNGPVQQTAGGSSPKSGQSGHGSGQQSAPMASDSYIEPTQQKVAANSPGPVSSPAATSPRKSIETVDMTSYANSSPPPEPPKSRGTVDMRSYNPKKFK